MIVQYDFVQEKEKREQDRILSKIIKKCFIGDQAQLNARCVLKKIKNYFEKQAYPWNHYGKVLQALALVQPRIFLECMFDDGKTAEQDDLSSILMDTLRTGTNPLSSIADEMILTWCGENPAVRYKKIAFNITPYIVKENGEWSWTSLALYLIDNTPDPLEMLDIFMANLHPTSWSGSITEAIWEKQIPLLEKLRNGGGGHISIWASNKIELIKVDIQKEREKELREHKIWNERFE